MSMYFNENTTKNLLKEIMPHEASSFDLTKDPRKLMNSNLLSRKSFFTNPSSPKVATTKASLNNLHEDYNVI